MAAMRRRGGIVGAGDDAQFLVFRGRGRVLRQHRGQRDGEADQGNEITNGGFHGMMDNR